MMLEDGFLRLTAGEVSFLVLFFIDVFSSHLCLLTLNNNIL